MKLYGTTTSPFVRRVRVVAAELDNEIDLVNTATDEGQAQLREVSPIRKVPVAVVDGRTLFDSRAIINWLTMTRGWGRVWRARDKWDDLNVLNAIDGALESVISLFYLKRDGVPVEGTPFWTRQLERTDAIFSWVAPRLSTENFGVAEISACAALDWMDFRQAYDTKRAPALAPVRAAWAERPSMLATRPHA